MREDDEPDVSAPGTSHFPPPNMTTVTPIKSLARFQSQRFRSCDSKIELCRAIHDPNSSAPRSPRHYSKSRLDPEDRHRLPRVTAVKDGKVFSTPEFVVNDCWKTTSTEIPVKLVELFKEKEGEDEEVDARVNKRKFAPEVDEKLSYTKEFHLLTEVQKARILTAVEEAIKKLANSDLKEFGKEARGWNSPEDVSLASEGRTVQKHFCKKFLLLWILMKVIELILCHIIQIAFLSNDSYFQRKSEFMPVVVAYYFTLFIVIFSMVAHVSCYTYVGAQNPCYFMCIVSLSILTFTTVLGILIILCSMQFYRSFREIFVLVLIAALLCSLIADLSVCYLEVKNFWNRVRQANEYYIP